MGTFIVKNAQVHVDKADLSAILSSCAINFSGEIQDVTVFGATSRSRLGSGVIRDFGFVHQGFVDHALAHDLAIYDRIGAASAPFSVAPEARAEGDPAFFGTMLQANFRFGGTVGEVAAFEVNAQCAGDLVSGKIAGTGAKTSTSQGGGLNLGAVTASQKVFAVLHVTAVAGTNPTLDLTIESDADNNFASPATQLTFTQATTTTSEIKSAAGAITDTWWRAKWTIGGTGSPSFTIFTAIGIISNIGNL